MNYPYHVLNDFLIGAGLRHREGRKHGALRPWKPFRLIRDGEVRGSGIFIANTYSLHCHHQNDSSNVSLNVWAKSKDSVHKSQ